MRGKRNKPGDLQKYVDDPAHGQALKEAAFKIWWKNRRLDEVSRALGVSADTVRQWRMSPWWEKRYNQEDMQGMDVADAKLDRIVEKATDIMEDRLDNGDIFYDQKNCKEVRVPVKLVTAAKVLESATQSKETLREINSRVAQSSMEDNLKQLLLEFRKFSEAKDITPETEIIEVDGDEEVP